MIFCLLADGKNHGGAVVWFSAQPLPVFGAATLDAGVLQRQAAGHGDARCGLQAVQQCLPQRRVAVGRLNKKLGLVVALRQLVQLFDAL